MTISQVLEVKKESDKDHSDKSDIENKEDQDKSQEEIKDDESKNSEEENLDSDEESKDSNKEGILNTILYNFYRAYQGGRREREE